MRTNLFSSFILDLLITLKPLFTLDHLFPLFRKEFCLPEKLDERYSVLDFVASHRFENCKKKLGTPTLTKS